MTTTLIAASVAGVGCVGCILWAICLKYCKRQANQQEDIYNISSQVQGQGQWPTHNAHVSLDHFTIANEANKYNDAPPSYEEAMSIAANTSHSSQVVPVHTAPVPKPAGQ